MLNIKKTCLHVAVLLILPATILAQAPDQAAPAAKPNKHMESHIGNLIGHSEDGAQLYYRYCWGCHGARGNGDGENAPYLNILPRNFVAAVFKCRSTPTGTLPLDSDIFNSIYRGFNFTNMPSWKTLTAQNRADLVAFIKTFSARWVTEKPGDPIVIPPEPKLTVESIK
ncbi:MAG: cytochrome c, partial [Candidatus Acidiferrum sp.]